MTKLKEQGRNFTGIESQLKALVQTLKENVIFAEFFSMNLALPTSSPCTPEEIEVQRGEREFTNA